LIATPAIEDAERLQGFEAGWTDISDFDPVGARKRWRMVGNAVSVPMAKWVAERLTMKHSPFDEKAEADELPTSGSYPSAAWGRDGRRRRSVVSEWPIRETPRHLASFLEFSAVPLSKKATQGFCSRLVASSCDTNTPSWLIWIIMPRQSQPAEILDPVAPDTSRRMTRTAQRDNRKERALRSMLHRRGLRFRIHGRLLEGSRRTVDIVFARARVAVFIDGCFWHDCPIHGTSPTNNAAWWRAKIDANVARDRDTDARLVESG
jgi:DNA mismatch endonuclease, patch repair protein